MRPFYWRQDGPRGTRINILGPIVRWRSDEVYRRLQVFPNIFYTARHSPQDQRSWWFVFFPFLFLGNDDFLVVPLGGVSHGLLGLDQLLLVTPLYARSRRVSGNPDDPVTYTIHHVLFPFIAWGSDGHGRHKFRIAPFYGKSVGRGGVKRGFILWPFWTWRRGPEERAFFLFPFYGRNETPTRRDTTILFPFYHRSENLLTGGRDVAVWPFWRRADDGDGVYVRRYWPVREFRRAGFTTTEYWAWPFWRRTHIDDERQFGRITWVAPFYRNVRLYSKADGTDGNKTIVWPFARWERTPRGGREVAIPSLSPIDAPALREFAEPFRPLISVFHKRIAPDGTREVSAAFGLVMTRRTAETKKVRILGGLLGWERDPGGRYLRLLWGIRLRTGEARPTR